MKGARYIRIISMVVIDLILFSLALYLAFGIQFDWNIHKKAAKALNFLLPWGALMRVVIFYFGGLYQWSFRYASFHEVTTVLRAVATGSLGLIALSYFNRYEFGLVLGRTVLVMDFLLCFFLVSAFRFFFRLDLRLRRGGNSQTRVLIIGAGESGQMIAGRLLRSHNGKYHVLGFIDDDPKKRFQRMQGLKVLGNKEDVATIVSRLKIREIIFAIPSASGQVIREYINSTLNSGIKFLTVPSLKNMLENKAASMNIREIRPTDLLGREMVKINNEEILNVVKNKSVLISGAGGSIGSELVKQISGFEPRHVILFDISENEVYFLEIDLKRKFPHVQYTVIIGDVKDVGLLRHIFRTLKPQIVFHAAAHKHVPLMENNPCSAVKNNIVGTRNLIYASEHYQAERFVLISTDKAVNPTNVMGATKRVTEMVCQAKAKTSKTLFMAVRFGNVLGSNGSVVQLFKKQLEEGRNLTVTHPDIRRYFMTVEEAVQLVLQAAAMGKGGEVFLLDMGEQVKIVELAKNMIALSGLELDKDIAIEFSGLRPGEKLYEELLHSAENDLATCHDQIFIAQPESFDLKKLHQEIREIIRIANRFDNDLVIKKLKHIVPTFKSPEEL